MNIYKKIGLGISFALFGLILFTLVPAHKASAATTQFIADPFNNTSKFIYNGGQITVLIASGTTNQQTLTFTTNSKSAPYVYKSDAAIFCTDASGNGKGPGVINPSSPAILTLAKSPSGATFDGTLDAFYLTTTGACNGNANGTKAITNQDSGTGGTPGLPSTLTDNSTGAVYGLINSPFPLYGLNDSKGTDCYGGSVILSNAAGTSGTVFSGLEGNGGTVPLQPGFISAGNNAGLSNSVLASALNLVSGCGFQDPGANTTGYTGSISSGLFNDTTPSAPAPGGGATGKSCESNDSAGAFSWILCPAFDLMDSVTGVFLNFVQGQLCFATGPTSSTDGIVCGGNNLTGGVHQAWTVFRNISSALLVVILLVVVISQAIGGGPFDAYTVRKMLPKIVLAVIFMQLSWVLVKWLIDLSNDLGTGIRDLMAAPFGGTSNLTLPNILGTQFGKIGNVGSGFVFFGGIAAAAVAGVIVSIPTLALLGLYVILALLTAFLVLVFRKLLIIMLVILAPVALVLWILPGTERYWKLWQDNFTKLLLMFPMIMGLITAGQILAYITSGSPNGLMFNPHLALAHLGPVPVPVLASVSNFAGVIIIIAAYFAPFFLLPQTYKWGGAAMGAASKGIAKMTEQAGGKQAKEYLNWRQGLSPWKQARAARKAEVERRTRLGFNQGLDAEGGWGRVRRARLGGVGRRGAESALRGRIVENAQSEIDKHVREEDQRALIDLTRRTLPQFHASDHDNIREAILQRRQIMVHHPGEDTSLPPTHEFNGAEYGSDPHRLRAAADRALIHGQMGAVDQYYTEAMASGNPASIAEATRFKDDNAEVLGRKLTHALKGYGVAVQATSGEISQQSGHEVESIIAEYSSRAVDPTLTPVARAAAQTSLDGYITRHQEALANPATRHSVDLRGTAAVEAYTEIRTAPPGAIPVGMSVASLAAMAPAARTAALAPLAPPLRQAFETVLEINTGAAAIATGRSDREANRSRYQSPGLAPDHIIPLVTI